MMVVFHHPDNAPLAVAVHPDHHFPDGPQKASGKLSCKYLHLNLHILHVYSLPEDLVYISDIIRYFVP